MAEIKFSQLTTAAQLTNDDIFALAQMQGGSLSSVKTSMIAVANYLNTQVQYTTAYNTQAKTTAGAINELKQLISLIPQFSIEVVEELPTEDIFDTTIYLVPAEDPEVGNYYEEYIHVNDAWELVGTTAVDLSAYYTKLEVDGLLATKASVTEVALKENKSDMPTDVRTIIKDCKTPKNATITNGIAQFECIEENLVKGLKVTMNPIQDLHGYDHPWAGGAGKNKLDISSVTTSTSANWGVTISNGELTVEHKNTYSTGVPKTADIELSAGTYCVSYNATTELVLDVYANGSFLKSVYDGGTFTLSASSTVYITFPNTQVTTITYKKVQLESGSTPTIYEPYSNICPISGRTEASVKRTGANQWDEVAEKGTINDTTGQNANDGLNQYTRSKNYIPVFEGETYCFKVASNGKVYYYDAEKTYMSYSGISNGAIKTIPSGCAYIRFWVNYSGAYNNDMSVNYPSTDTEYHAYTAETHTHQYSETIYGGNDDFVNGGATSTMGMVDLGTLTWTKQTGTKTYFRTANEVGNMKKNTSPILTQGLLCSSYPEDTWSHTVDTQGYDATICEGWLNKSYIAIYDESKNDLTAEQFKTAMDGVQLCYELATPTTIETSAEEITTVAGTNIISGTEPISECQYTELATVDDLRKIIGGQ